MSLSVRNAGRSAPEWERATRNVQRGLDRAVEQSDGSAADAAERMGQFIAGLGPHGKLVAHHLLLLEAATLRTDRGSVWRPVR